MTLTIWILFLSLIYPPPNLANASIIQTDAVFLGNIAGQSGSNGILISTNVALVLVAV
jgi:hypothetical protein